MDGQQRLTALCILLACIRDLAALADATDIRSQLQDKIIQPAKSLDNIPSRNRIEVRDSNVFNQMVGMQGGTTTYQPSGAVTPAESRYILARDIFHERLKSFSAEEAEGLAKYIFQHCVIIFLTATDFEEAFRLFTIVNDRGKQLRRIDIIKARNIAPNVIIDDDARRRYANRWETMEESLGETNFEDLFYLLRLIYIRDKPQADLLREFETRIFNQPGKPTPGKSFIDELEIYVKLYEELFVDFDYLDATSDGIKFRTLISAMVWQFSASEWRACVLAYARKFGTTGLYEYILGIEKVYLTHWVSGMRKDERYSVYTDLLKSMDTGRYREAIKATTEKSDPKAIQEACLVGNFYTSGYSKYLLLRAEILASELDHAREFNVRSVEHVLPQNPNTNSEWCKNFSPQDIDAVVNTAGNLVLLSKSKNSSASNREFKDKKTSYLQPRVSDFPRSMQVLSEPAWTRTVIEERTKKFAESILNNP
ncbi:hypothetical protein AB431_12360 [Mycobacterium sp. EPa45]|nr:hypothetical protein AB431_12360 [Mycobacterium sp. EPa45]